MAKKSVETGETSIGQLVRKAETDFISGYTQTSKYVNESLYEDINKIEAYLNSKHTSGSTDSLGRDKPFFNIVLAARNIWARATDFDRKDVKIKPTKSKDIVATFLATIFLQDYMRRDNFGTFLNKWGTYLASYNSAIVKFVEKEGKLHTMVMDWNKMIVDVVDFDSNPRIELLELTEAQLRKRKGYDQTIVENLCNALQARENTDRLKKDNKNNYIKLYEIHGELPLSYLTGKDKDEYEYVQQMQVITFLASKETGKFDDYVLYSGREEKDPYMITWLLPSTDGSISLWGAVKSLFEAQWMTNHSVKAIKDQLDLASKLIFQTSDGNFVGQNALSAIESGDILIYKENMPLQVVQNNSHDIGSLESFQSQWKALAQEITNTPAVLSGQASNSQSAYRREALMIQQAQANFDVMKQNKGLFIEQMLREYIIPFLKKQMGHSKELATVLEAHDITKIDSIYVPNEAIKRFNKKAVQAVINGTQLPSLQQEQQQVQSELAPLGNQRFFKPSEFNDKEWADIFKDIEWEAECDIANEASDTQLMLTTLQSVLQTIATNPSVLSDPNAKLLFNKILSASGEVSPIELSSIPPQSNAPANKVSESISFKDLPPEGQVQMAGQAGIKINPPQNNQPTMPINGGQPVAVGK